jgi:hypothetical protein
MYSFKYGTSRLVCLYLMRTWMCPFPVYFHPLFTYRCIYIYIWLDACVCALLYLRDCNLEITAVIAYQFLLQGVFSHALRAYDMQSIFMANL